MKICDKGVIYLFRLFVRILFSRNLAYAKFCENKNLAKISEFTVNNERTDLTVAFRYLHHNYQTTKETQPSTKETEIFTPTMLNTDKSRFVENNVDPDQLGS